MSVSAHTLVPARDGRDYPSNLYVNTGATAFSAFRVVRLTSASGVLPVITAFTATTKAHYEGPLVVLQSGVIATNTSAVLATRRGIVKGTAHTALNTSGGAVGDPVYIGASGALTLTAPTVSDATVLAKVGYVTFVHATLGAVYFDPEAFRSTWVERASTATRVTEELIMLTVGAIATSTAWVAPRACTIVDCWTVKGTGTAASTADVKLKNASNDVTTLTLDSLAPGAVVRASTLHATHASLAAAASVTAVTSGANTSTTVYFRVVYS